jgi:peptidyl-prolyl cis-trans isomerase SurA
MKKRLWLPVFCLALVSSYLFGADSVIQEIIVHVNSDIITRADLQHGQEQLMSDLRQQYGAQAEQYYQDRQKDVLRDLIDQDLLLQKGKQLGITGDNETIKKLDEIRKQLNLETMEDVQRAAEKEGVSYEDFKQNIKNGIITQQVISREVGAHIQITPDEIRKFYEEHKQEMAQPEQVRLEEILISTQPKGSTDSNADPDDATLAAAQKKAQDLLDQIRKGASFEDLAKKFSDDANSAPQGGDLGFFKRGSMVKSLEDTIFAMKAGDVSDVVRTKQGFILMKVSEHTAAGVPPLKDVDEKVQSAIYYQKLSPAVRAYLTKLREEAYVDLKAGFVDTGASPNETKPIFVNTTTTQEQAKKKKKKHFLVF